MNTNDTILLWFAIIQHLSWQIIKSNYAYYVIRNVKRLTNIEIC